jgi:hypothetical protein
MGFVLPTATGLYFNRHRLKGELKTAELPAKPWAQNEAHELLSRSEDRLRSLEAKGPGLATVAAIVAAGVVAAIVEGGGDSTLLGKVLLGVAAWYSIWSLVIPIYLVGPQARATIDLNHLISAAGKDDPEQYLAEQAQQAAQGNVRRTQRIANLQNAARTELSAALLALSAWLMLGPAVGLLERDEPDPDSQPHPPTQTHTQPRTTPPSATTPPTSTTPRPRTTPKPRPRPRMTPTTPSTGGAQAPSEPR